MRFRHSKIIALAFLAVCLLTANAQTYTNPVIAGDFPDPTVIRVGADFYAATTTGNWSPHFTLLHSRDLVNWKIVGAIFTEKPAWAKADFWAVELARDKGKYYAFYTARRDEGAGKKGTLCVAVAIAEKPTGPYQDKGALVCQEMGSIDPFFIRDENGKPFLIWKEDGNDRQQPTWLYAQQLDESLTKLIGKPTKLFRNDALWENHVVEGTFIVRRNGWYYHFYSGNACCGRDCNYALGVARAKSILGPWEKNPKNPILAANEVWQCPGHGSIVTTADGRDFLLYHAYRKRPDAFIIGREALLDEIKWTADGWATINDGRGASDNATLPFPKYFQNPVSNNLFEDFTTASFSPIWNYPLGKKGSVETANGFLTLDPNNNQKTNETGEAVLVSRTVAGTYTATTKIQTNVMKAGERAGLSAYSWRGGAVGVSVENGKVFTWKRQDNKETTFGNVDLPPYLNAVFLRLQATNGDSFKFAYSTDEKEWRSVGETVSGIYFEGARIALMYAGKTANSGAKFDWIRVSY